MKQHEIKVGEIYSSYYKGQGIYIFRVNRSGYLNMGEDGNIHYFPCGGNIAQSNGFHDFFYPTEEQKQHFLMCESAGHYVPLYVPSPLLIF